MVTNCLVLWVWPPASCGLFYRLSDDHFGCFYTHWRSGSDPLEQPAPCATARDPNYPTLKLGLQRFQGCLEYSALDQLEDPPRCCVVHDRPLGAPRQEKGKGPTFHLHATLGVLGPSHDKGTAPVQSCCPLPTQLHENFCHKDHKKLPD